MPVKTQPVTPPNAFIGGAAAPTDAELQTALGASKTAWDNLIAGLAADHGVAIQEWKCYSKKWGWSLRLKRGKRTIVWLAPFLGCFQVVYILGGKAVLAARESDLPAPILQAIDEAPKYPEGTGVRLLVKSLEDLPPIRKLAVVKLAN